MVADHHWKHLAFSGEFQRPIFDDTTNGRLYRSAPLAHHLQSLTLMLGNAGRMTGHFRSPGGLPLTPRVLPVRKRW